MYHFGKIYYNVLFLCYNIKLRNYIKDCRYDDNNVWYNNNNGIDILIKHDDDDKFYYFQNKSEQHLIHKYYKINTYIFEKKLSFSKFLPNLSLVPSLDIALKSDIILVVMGRGRVEIDNFCFLLKRLTSKNI